MERESSETSGDDEEVDYTWARERIWMNALTMLLGYDLSVATIIVRQQILASITTCEKSEFRHDCTERLSKNVHLASKAVRAKVRAAERSAPDMKKAALAQLDIIEAHFDKQSKVIAARAKAFAANPNMPASLKETIDIGRRTEELILESSLHYPRKTVRTIFTWLDSILPTLTKIFWIQILTSVVEQLTRKTIWFLSVFLLGDLALGALEEQIKAVLDRVPSHLLTGTARDGVLRWGHYLVAFVVAILFDRFVSPKVNRFFESLTLKQLRTLNEHVAFSALQVTVFEAVSARLKKALAAAVESDSFAELGDILVPLEVLAAMKFPTLHNLALARGPISEEFIRAVENAR
jgi:hypothetical protein